MVCICIAVTNWAYTLDTHIPPYITVGRKAPTAGHVCFLCGVAPYAAIKLLPRRELLLCSLLSFAHCTQIPKSCSLTLNLPPPRLASSPNKCANRKRLPRDPLMTAVLPTKSSSLFVTSTVTSKTKPRPARIARPSSTLQSYPT